MFCFFVVNAGDVHASIPIPPGDIPGQPQVLVNPYHQENPDGVGLDAVNKVMDFVSRSFGGAKLVDCHSVSHLRIKNLLFSSLTIERKATEDYFPVVLVIVLYKVVITF